MVKLIDLCASLSASARALFFDSRSGIGSTPRYTVWKPEAELNSHPVSGAAKKRKYSRTCVERVATRSHGGIVAGNAGAACPRRHRSRAPATRKTVTPIHLWNEK